MRILVVEDDPVLSDGLRVGLSLFGATLDTVSSCADGRAAVALTDFDALVLDLMLPDGSGLDLLRELRASGDRTPILLLTALNEVADRIKGLDAGADDYLGKPFVPFASGVGILLGGALAVVLLRPDVPLVIRPSEGQVGS
jgi:two-component system response regulator QseB